MKKFISIQLLLFLSIGLFSQHHENKTKAQWFRFENFKNKELDKFQLGLNNNDELIKIRTDHDSKGRQHIRYQQKHNGIPIWESLLISHWDNGYLNSINGNFIPNLSLNIQPTLSKNCARDLALKNINAECYAWHSTEIEKTLKYFKNEASASFFPEGELYIFSPDFNEKNARLAYEFDIYTLEPLRRVKMLLDAHTGEILSEIDLIHSANGTGNTLYYEEQNICVTPSSSDSSFSLENIHVETRDGTPQPSLPWPPPSFPWDPMDYFTGSTGVPITNDNSDFGDRDSAAIGVHWASEQWYDFIFSTYGWDSYDNQGGKILNVVHYGDNLNNAFTNGIWISYGDGNDENGAWVSLDITAHEITHELIRSTANFIYEGESGALSESFADIFAVMVERHALDTFNWTIGEDITTDGQGIRKMDSLMIYNDTLTGWYNGLNDHGGVHVNNGVQNYWFYLLSEDPEVGIDKAAEICFHSLTYYLTPYSNYHDARNASIQAAFDLYNDDTIAGIVCEKWSQVGVTDIDTNCQINDSYISEYITIDSSTSNALIIGNPYVINWTDSGNIDSVGLSYIANGNSLNTIIDALVANDSSYTWIVPEINTLSDSIYIYVYNASNYAIVDSIGPLTIQECPANSDFNGDLYTCLGDETVLQSIAENHAYRWIIGGDTISTNSILHWVPDVSGNIDIELRVYDEEMACMTSTTKQVFVSSPSDTAAMFSCQKIDQKVYFNALNFDPSASYTWDFDNGNISNGSSTEQNFNSYGLYNVCLTVVNTCDTFEYCKNVTVLPDMGNTNLCDTIWQSFTEDNVLPAGGNNIRTFHEDASGNIWIGTYGGGLIKIDSLGNWESIDLVPSYINVMAGDNDNIYLGTQQGLFIYNLTTSDTTKYNSSNSDLPNNIVRSLEKDYDGNIWIGTAEGGLAKYNVEDDFFEISNVNTIYNIRAIAIEDTNSLWLGTEGGGLLLFNISNDSIISILDTTETDQWPNNNISTLLITADNTTLWVGTDEAGLIQYDLANDTFIDHDGTRVWGIDEDTLGNVYFGTYAAGVLEYNPNTELVTTAYNSLTYDLLGNTIHELLITSKGALWVGTTEGIAVAHLPTSPSFQMTTTCNNEGEIDFTNESYYPNLTEWQINGEVVSHTKDLEYQFESSGTYEITLITTNSYGCQDVYMDSVAISAFASELAAQYPENIRLCGENEVMLNSGLDSYVSYEWYLDNQLLVNTADTLMAETTAIYKLKVTDTCGETAEKIFDVVISPDCVWPGDTNLDGWVNNKDLINIGLFYGSTGPERSITSNSWFPQVANNWNDSAQEINLKHIDANGDGEINELDKEVVMENFGKNNGSLYFPSIPSPIAAYSLVPVFEGIDPITNELEISIKIVSDEGLDLSYYGLSFTLIYETASSGINTSFKPLYLHPDISGEDAISLRYQGTKRLSLDSIIPFTSIAVTGTNHMDRFVSADGNTINSSEYSLAHFGIGDEIELPGGGEGNYLRIISGDILMVNSLGDTISVGAKELMIYLLDDNYNFTATVSPMTCLDPLGEITILPSNTNTAYNYSWNTGDTTQTITITEEDIYIVTITNADGFLDTFEITINNNPELSLQTETTEDNTLCIETEGGNGDFIYYWHDGSNGSCTPIWSGLEYTVTVVDGNGCTASMTGIIPDATSPITTLESVNESINIYPNPTSGDILFLEYNSDSNNSIGMKIFDINGRLISSQKENAIQGLNNFKINIKGIPKGIYILHFNNNGQIDNHRFTIMD